jgi:preprotein translocase subunit Sec61beta
MAKNKKSEGFHSAAGLIRYFDSEDDKAFKINPWIVVGLCIGVSALVLVFTYAYPV